MFVLVLLVFRATFPPRENRCDKNLELAQQVKGKTFDYGFTVFNRLELILIANQARLRWSSFFPFTFARHLVPLHFGSISKVD